MATFVIVVVMVTGFGFFSQKFHEFIDRLRFVCRFRFVRRFVRATSSLHTYKSETTLRSHQERPKDPADPTKQDAVVYRIPSECGKVYIGETRRPMGATSEYPATHALHKSTASFVVRSPVVDETNNKS